MTKEIIVSNSNRNAIVDGGDSIMAEDFLAGKEVPRK